MVATHQFEQCRMQSREGERSGMCETNDPRLHLVDERDRSIELAERPQDVRQIAHCADPGVLPESKGQIVVSTRSEQGKCLFQMIPGFDVLARELLGDPSN